LQRPARARPLAQVDRQLAFSGRGSILVPPHGPPDGVKCQVARTLRTRSCSRRGASGAKSELRSRARARGCGRPVVVERGCPDVELELDRDLAIRDENGIRPEGAAAPARRWTTSKAARQRRGCRRTAKRWRLMMGPASRSRYAETTTIRTRRCSRAPGLCQRRPAPFVAEGPLVCRQSPLCKRFLRGRTS